VHDRLERRLGAQQLARRRRLGAGPAAACRVAAASHAWPQAALPFSHPRVIFFKRITTDGIE
jgi:hypothetical protein